MHSSFRYLTPWLLLFGLWGTAHAAQPSDSLREVWNNLGDFELRAEAILDQGKQLRRADPQGARELFEYLLAQAEAEASVSWQAQALVELGVLSYLQENLPQSNRYYFQALEALSAQPDPALQGRIYNNIGWNHERLGTMDLAREYFMRSRQLAQEHNQLELQAIVLNNLAVLYKNQGQYDSALVFLSQSMELNRALGKEDQVAYNLNNIGVNYTLLNRPEEAIEQFQQALAINRVLGDTVEILNNLLNLGVQYHRLGDFQQAKDSLLAWYPVVARQGREIQHESWLGWLVDAAKATGDYPLALRMQDHLLDLKDSLHNARLEESMQELEAQYHLSEGKRQLLASQEAMARQSAWLMGIGGVLAVSLLGIGLLIYIYRNQRKSQKAMQALNQQISQQAKALQEANDEIRRMNADLENRVEERTQVIQQQNEYLRRFAFLTSHRIRASLARVMGLTNLMEIDLPIEDQQPIVGKLKSSAQELDGIVHELNDSLHQEVFQDSE